MPQARPAPTLRLRSSNRSGRGRYFQTADPKPQGLVRGGVEALVELDRLAGKDRHHARDVDLKDEAGRVGGRAAGFEQRPSV